MVFYTIKGPSHLLEVHEHKLILKKRLWLKILTGPGTDKVWETDQLIEFKISKPKYFIWGKLEWVDNKGILGKIRFSINSLMMERITRYIQLKISKTLLKAPNSDSIPKKEPHETEPVQNLIA